MTVDFADHFWGEKHMGFSVLYQNMKVGQATARELADFLKERASMEEDYGKYLAKSMSKVTTYSQAGHTISGIWVLMKNALERIGQSQTRLASTLSDLAKEVQKYGEELHKTHRAIKEKEHGTFDAVNMIQTTTTCVQKAKETYSSRCVELEKLKRENGAPKDVNKLEGKVSKAREDYKSNVEKYEKVRDNFEEKMRKSAGTFQEQETKHIERMKKLLASFAQQKEEANSLSSQVFTELKYAIENADTNTILSELVKNKATGNEKPGSVSFEEPDLATLLPSPPSATTPSNDSASFTRQSSAPSPPKQTSLIGSLGGSHVQTPPSYNLINTEPISQPTSTGNGLSHLNHTNSVHGLTASTEADLLSIDNNNDNDNQNTSALAQSFAGTTYDNSSGPGAKPAGDQSSTSSSASSSMTHSISKGKGLSIFSRSKKERSSASPATTPTAEPSAGATVPSAIPEQGSVLVGGSSCSPSKTSTDEEIPITLDDDRALMIGNAAEKGSILKMPSPTSTKLRTVKFSSGSMLLRSASKSPTTVPSVLSRFRTISTSITPERSGPGGSRKRNEICRSATISNVLSPTQDVSRKDQGSNRNSHVTFAESDIASQKLSGESQLKKHSSTTSLDRFVSWTQSHTHLNFSKTESSEQSPSTTKAKPRKGKKGKKKSGKSSKKGQDNQKSSAVPNHSIAEENKSLIPSIRKLSLAEAEAIRAAESLAEIPRQPSDPKNSEVLGTSCPSELSLSPTLKRKVSFLSMPEVAKRKKTHLFSRKGTTALSSKSTPDIGSLTEGGLKSNSFENGHAPARTNERAVDVPLETSFAGPVPKSKSITNLTIREKREEPSSHIHGPLNMPQLTNGADPSSGKSGTQASIHRDLGIEPLKLRNLEQSPKSGRKKTEKYTEFGNRQSNARSSKWFFKRGNRKKGKEKGTSKDKEGSIGQDSMTRAPTEGSEESRSNASEEHQRGGEVLVDAEGFSIIPTSHDNREDEPDKWSSDDSDDDEPKKIHVKIKPLNASAPAKTVGSVDELRDVVGTLMKPPTPTPGLLPQPGCAGGSLFSDDFNQTMPARIPSLLPKSQTVGGSGTNENDPWAPTAPSGRKLIQPSYTGDGRLSHSFGGPGYMTTRSTSGSTMPAWPIQAETTGPRQRPRPKGQTQMINLANRQGCVDMDGSSLGMNFSQRSISMNSLGDISGESMPRGPSPGTGGEVIPVAIAVTETVHALFQGSDIAKGRIRVFGSVHVSFPGSSISHLLSEDPYPPLAFKLVNAERVHALIPNKAVLSADAVSQFSSSAVHEFSFDQKGLSVQLRKLCDQRPGAPFYNLEVLRYEVRNPVAPLLLMSFWKCEAGQSDVRIDYRLNMECPVDKALLNLQFITPVSGGVSNVVAKPDADWDEVTEKLNWKLTELSKHGDSNGSLKARLMLNNGPSSPAASAVQFQATEACLSGTTLEVDCENYRLSLLKRKLVSGKYICEPETR